MLNKLYLVAGIAMIAFYGVTTFCGWEFGGATPQVVPSDVRQSPGGYRSFHFWHSGYQGGK